MAERRLEQKDKDLIFPEAHSTIEEIFGRMNSDPDFVKTNYGHAAGMVVTHAYAKTDKSPEEQKAHLRVIALKYIDKYGLEFIQFLKPELRAALEIDDPSGK